MILPKDALVRIQEGRQSLILRSGPKCMYAVGKPYKVKSHRDHEARLTITITLKTQRELGSLDLRDARRLGYRTTHDLIRAQPRLDTSELVWLLSFETGDVSDTPRLLAKRPGPGHDYVSSTAQAMNSSAEEVSGHLHKQYAARSEETYAQILSAKRKRALEAISEVQEYATSSRERKRLRAAANQIRRLDVGIDRNEDR